MVIQIGLKRALVSVQEHTYELQMKEGVAMQESVESEDSIRCGRGQKAGRPFEHKLA